MPSVIPAGKRWRAFVATNNIRESKTFETKGEANAWAANRELEIINGGGPRRGLKKTLHQAFDKFIAEELPNRGGKRWEKIRVERFKRELDDVRMDKLGPEHLSEWRNERLKSVKGATVRRDMNLLKAVLETARRDWGWLETNPMADVKRPAGSPSRKRLITDDEVKKIVAELCYSDEMPVILVKQRIAVAFLIALETGMRAGELLKAEVRGKVAHLLDQEEAGDATKNGDEREVPLSKRARELFAKVGNKIELNSSSFDTMFRDARKAAGLKGFTFHDSRHYACTKLAKKLQPMDLAKMMGHRSLKQTLEYYNPATEDLADLLD